MKYLLHNILINKKILLVFCFLLFLFFDPAKLNALTRCEVLDAAQRWVDAGVMYSWDAWYTDPTTGWCCYRTDCSGFVSAVWRLPPPGHTTYSFAGGPWDDGVSYVIDASELQPGDALNYPGDPNQGTGHIVLYVSGDFRSGWVEVYEESSHGNPALHRWRSINPSTYLPIRLVGIEPCPPEYAGLSQVSGNEAIALVNWPDTGTWPLDGHAEVFITTPSGDMMHLYSAGNGDDWTAPSKLDGGAKCGFAASYWPPPKNYPEIFTPWHETSTAHLWLASGEWNTFQDFGGGHLEHLSTVVWRDRRVEVFGLGQDGAIWHNWWVNDSTYWSGWQSLGGNFVTGAGAISWGDGHVEIFATDSSGKVWHNWTGDFPGGWHGWESIEGNIASRPVPVRWPDGHVEVFARGTDGLLYHSWYAGEPGWVTFVPESTGVRFEGEPSVAMNPEGAGTPAGPEIVVRGQDSKVLHTWWDGTSYRQFEPLGNQSTASDPFAWIRTDGTMEVFVIDPEGNLAHIRRSESKIWGEWKIIGSGLEPCVESQPPQPDLQPDVPAETTQPDSFEPSEITEVIEPAEDMLAEAFPEREPIESKSSCGCSIPSKNSNANSILPLLILLILLRRKTKKG